MLGNDGKCKSVQAVCKPFLRHDGEKCPKTHKRKIVDGSTKSGLSYRQGNVQTMWNHRRGARGVELNKNCAEHTDRNGVYDSGIRQTRRVSVLLRLFATEIWQQVTSLLCFTDTHSFICHTETPDLHVDIADIAVVRPTSTKITVYFPLPSSAYWQVRVGNLQSFVACAHRCIRCWCHPTIRKSSLWKARPCRRATWKRKKERQARTIFTRPKLLERDEV